MASTLEQSDVMRSEMATRFGSRVSDVVVPTWARDVMVKFKQSGGKVTPARTDISERVDCLLTGSDGPRNDHAHKA